MHTVETIIYSTGHAATIGSNSCMADRSAISADVVIVRAKYTVWVTAWHTC